MLASARDAIFADLESVNLTLVTVIFGTVRNAFERELSVSTAEGLRRELTMMCRAYLNVTAAG